jgi:hypothetical protein
MILEIEGLQAIFPEKIRFSPYFYGNPLLPKKLNNLGFLSINPHGNTLTAFKKKKVAKK